MFVINGITRLNHCLSIPVYLPNTSFVRTLFGLIITTPEKSKITKYAILKAIPTSGMSEINSHNSISITSISAHIV